MTGRPSVLTAASMLLLSVAACGGSESDTDTTPTGDGSVTEADTAADAEADTGAATSTTSGSETTAIETGDDAAVAVIADVEFASNEPGLAPWSEASFDVYTPDGASDLPLVIVLPPHTLTKENPATVQLARAIAERGAVAVALNWSQFSEPEGSLRDPALLAEVAHAGRSFAGCGISVAVSRAAEFGADPSRLVIVGELLGANTASTLVLGFPDPYPGCAADDTAWTAAGLVGIDGDWMVGYPPFDQVAEAAVETMSPWPLLDGAPMVSTVFAVTDAAAGLTRRCDASAEWLAARDADGRMRARLDAIGAADDGCLDFGDFAEATAAEMRSLGFDAETAGLTDPATRSGTGAQVLEFGPADLELLVAAVMEVAG